VLRRSGLLLSAAAVLTGAAVAAGTVWASQPDTVTLTLVEGPATVVTGAEISARADVVTRTAPRQAGSARPATALATPPPYHVAPAGKPIVKLPPQPTSTLAAKAEAAAGADAGADAGGGADEGADAAAVPVAAEPFTFQIGTLNILGSNHTQGKGGYGPGTGRAAMLAGAIQNRGVDIVGLQEVQDDQLAVLRSKLGGYTIWPGQGLGNNGVRLQIAFRSDLFELVSTGSITTVFDHLRRPIPYVLLRDRASQSEFYVVDVHNSPQGQEADRDSATEVEIGLLKSLQSAGKPVFVMGDTNEHSEFVCKVSAATGMVGSNDASASGGGCSNGYGPLKIDKILGSGGVDFSSHVVDYGAPIRTATDHAFVHATVTVTPEVSPGG
jgi:endonuclease/exonuclease/phosphatase family metal-dependent hydrolase